MEELRTAAREIRFDQLTDDFLLPFLLTRKWDKKRALKLLKNYWNLRESNPQLFVTTVLQLQPVLQQKLSTLIQLDDGSQIFVFRIGPWDPKSCSLEDIFRFNVTVLRVAALSKITQENGLTAVVDLEGLSFSQARRFTPYYANLLVSLLQDSFPIRFQAIHFIRMPYLFSMVMTVVWPLLSEKLKQRVKLHSSIGSLNNHLDPRCLPFAYGGSSGDIDWSAVEAAFVKIQLII